MSLWKKSCVVLIIWKHYFGFLLDALFGLTWRMLTHVRLIQSRHKPHPSFNVALSLCMIMAVIAVLVGRSQSFASPHFYWVWALLVHPTPKNQVVPKCPPYIPISNLLFQSTFGLLLSILQIKLFLVLCENWSVKLSQTWWHTLLFLF
jgi:hypothetical protein